MSFVYSTIADASHLIPAFRLGIERGQARACPPTSQGSTCLRLTCPMIECLPGAAYTLPISLPAERPNLLMSLLPLEPVSDI